MAKTDEFGEELADFVRRVAELIDSVLTSINTESEAGTLATVKQQVTELTAKFPLPYRA